MKASADTVDFDLDDDDIVEVRAPSRRFGQWLGMALLVACWIQFTNIWYWPPAEPLALNKLTLPSAKLLAAPFQYVLWLSIMGGLVLCVRRDGLLLLKQLRLFWPYLVFMLVTSVLGIMMGESLRLTVLWLLSVLGGAVIASLLERRVLLGTLGVLALLTVALSVLSYFLLPAVGVGYYNSDPVLRGIFDNKNQAGSICGLAFVMLFALGREIPSAVRLPGLLFAALCLVLSGSMTALGGAALAVAYLALIQVMRRRVSSSLGVLVVGFSLLVIVLLVLFFAPIVAESMGRDLTLTGRTTIWEVYLNEIQDVLLFGSGPGSFTNVSVITVRLAEKLKGLGNIFYPHNFLIGTLGDLGILGLLYTVFMFAYVIIFLPLRHEGLFAFAAAAVGVTMMLQGLTETLDAVRAGPTWFFLALFLVAHERGRRALAWERHAATTGGNKR